MTNGQVYDLRTILRFVVGIILLGVYLYALLTGNPAAEQLGELAWPIISALFVIDSAARVAQKRGS